MFAKFSVVPNSEFGLPTEPIRILSSIMEVSQYKLEIKNFIWTLFLYTMLSIKLFAF